MDKPYLVFVFENGGYVTTEDFEFARDFTALARSSTLSKVVLRNENDPEEKNAELLWADLLHPVIPQKE
jgi:hypothetical protein